MTETEFLIKAAVWFAMVLVVGLGGMFLIVAK